MRALWGTAAGLVLCGCSTTNYITTTTTTHEPDAGVGGSQASSATEASSSSSSTAGVGGGAPMGGASSSSAEASSVSTGDGGGGAAPCDGACDAHYQACADGACAAVNSCAPMNPPFGDPDWQTRCPVLPVGAETILTLLCAAGDEPKGCAASTAGSVQTNAGPMLEWCCVEGMP